MKNKSPNSYIPAASYHHRSRIMKSCFLITICVFIAGSCNTKEPSDFPYFNIAGWVIGKETCHSDPEKEYWLLSCTYYPNSPKIGDEIVVNNQTYTNVVKVKGLAPALRVINTIVSIDYLYISPDRITSYSCDVANPVTYSLRELQIINQAYIP